MPIAKRRLGKNVIEDDDDEDIEMKDEPPKKEEKKKTALNKQDLENIREARDDKVRATRSEVTSTTHRDTTANLDDFAGNESDAGSVKSLKQMTGKTESGGPKPSIANLIKP